MSELQPMQRPPAARASGAALILGATVLSGVSGYLVIWSVAASIGPARYAAFAVFWSALYLAVGILSGLQQESARATVAREISDAPRATKASLVPYGALFAVVVLIVVGLSGLWWGPVSLGAAHAGLVLPVAVGAALDCGVAVLTGVLAGSQMWRLAALALGLDGVLRLVFVVVALLVGADVNGLAWAVVLPFPLVVIIVVAFAPGRIRAAARTAMSLMEFTRNAAQTMLAASSTALLVNGFPLVLSLTAAATAAAAGTDASNLGALILAITLTRAPILVPLMALQSFLITRFAVAPERVRRTLLALVGAILAATVLLGAAAWLWGGALLGLLFGAAFVLPPEVLIALIGSSGLVGVLCVTGPALLARNRHGAYTSGWVGASVVTVAILFLPLPLELRSILALSLGPAVGIVIHAAALARRGRTATASAGRL
ncbi:hypothetical protein [Leifsonia sp. NPDC058230]|uniref:hypothetical protein n=1 Tax=Leifsonia sp. NPDC058230 TaxID=3346391 RepID=UPI0036D91C19